MGHYKSNVRDITFNLFEVFGSGELLGRAPFTDLDEPTVRDVLAQLAELAEVEVLRDGQRRVDGDEHVLVLLHLVAIGEGERDDGRRDQHPDAGSEARDAERSGQLLSLPQDHGRRNHRRPYAAGRPLSH